MKNINPLLMTDGYKTGHHLMYAPKTTMVYSNYTCRNTDRMHEDAQDIVVFGVQYVFKYINELWNENFFNKNKTDVCLEAKMYLSNYLGCDYDVSHFEALHDLGYLPIEILSLDEGTIIKAGVPLFTIKNTLSPFFWVTNFLETLISTLIWKPVHSASLALAYKKILTEYAKDTDKENIWFVDFQGHDFSFRGMQSADAAISSGMGFATSFKGSDTIPILFALDEYYNATEKCYSVNATEHSVMCSGSKEDEIGTFERLMNTFPKGVLSVVSDTWDLWKVLTDYLPALKTQIMNRDGKLVVRPDSGEPVDIICGDEKYKDNTPQYKGVIELLWDEFGGTINEQGYKVLDSHVGAIYGDSITLGRAKLICEKLKQKGFASTNIVLGIGSYSMGYATRDQQGGAVKSTYIEIDGEGVEIFKDPITDNGVKKSAKGLLRVTKDLELVDQCTKDEALYISELKPVFRNGKFIKEVTFDEIRERISKNIKK